MQRVRFWSGWAALALMLSAAAGTPAKELIEASNPRAEPFKRAVAALDKAIASGSLEKAKAEYVGDGADLELLSQYVRGFAAAKAMRAAIEAKSGKHEQPNLRAMDASVAQMGVHDFNSVIFDDDPDRAGSSADTPLGVGIEFKRVKGEWKVLSLASRPDTPEQHIKRLKSYIEAVEAITAKVKADGYAKPDDAIAAANEAEERMLGF